jgi:hypothetical protein
LIQKSVSENAQNAVLGVEKYKNISVGKCPIIPLTITIRVLARKKCFVR